MLGDGFETGHMNNLCGMPPTVGPDSAWVCEIEASRLFLKLQSVSL